MNNTLQDLRKSLDNIDSAIVTLLAERFRVSRKVGLLKRELALPPQDESREAALFSRIEKLAEEAGLDAEFTRKLWRQIINEVIREHEAIQTEGAS